MLGVIIFDRLNDVMFSHGDEKFEEHIRCMAARNGLFYPAFSEAVPETRGERADVLLQLFSPFLASQRIMALEFHDPYSEVECENGLKMVFHEYLTYQCLCLSRNSALAPRKYISAVVSLAKLLCGPVLHRLKSMDGGLARMLSSMLESYCQLQRTNQAYHVEAVERLIIGDQVQNKMVSLLQRVVTGLPSGARSHAFLTVDGTLVSLYSGSKVTELSPAAVLSLLLLVHAVTPNAGQAGESGADPDGTSSFGASMNAGGSTGFSASMGGAGGGGSMSEPGTGGGPGGGSGGNAEESNLVHEELCFLSASRSPLSPYLVYVVHVWPGMALVIVCDLCLTDISGGLCEAIESVARYQQAVTAFQRDQVYAHLKHGLTVLFACAKQIRHNSEVRQLLGRLQAQWDQLRRLKVDAVLCSGQQVPPAVDQGLAALSRTLEAAFEALCHALPERATLTTGHLLQLLEQVQHELDHYRSFLLARAVSNATVETRSHLSISRYLENFPDLVHFIYVDRSVHLMTAPSTRPPDGSHDLTETVRKMIDLAYKYLREGHMSIIWRDQHYSYGHFLWFEDAMGNPQKARESPRRLKALYADWQPGILVRDYFSALVSVCFPEAAPEEVRCYQLFLVHRGPVQSDRVLQQSQQIARTVWEVSGAAAAPLDLL